MIFDDRLLCWRPYLLADVLWPPRYQGLKASLVGCQGLDAWGVSSGKEAGRDAPPVVPDGTLLHSCVRAPPPPASARPPGWWWGPVLAVTAPRLQCTGALGGFCLGGATDFRVPLALLGPTAGPPQDEGLQCTGALGGSTT